MLIFNNPLELLVLYLRFNRFVFKTMMYLVLALIALVTVGGFFLNFYKLFSAIWPTLHFDFSLVPQTFLILFKSIKAVTFDSWQAHLNFITYLLCFYFYLKFVLNLDSLIAQIGKSTFEKALSVKQNLEKIIVNLWAIQVLNIFLLLIEPWVGMDRLSKFGDNNVLIKLFSVLESALDFVTLDLSGITPLVFLLIIELLHRLSKKNHDLEDEIGTVV